MCGVGGSTIYVNGDDDPTRHLEMDVIYASPGVEVACATRKSISLFGMPRSIQGVTLVASEPIRNAHLMAECGTSPQPGFLFDRHILEPLPRYRGHLAPPSLILFSRPSLLALCISALSLLLYFSLEDMLGHKQIARAAMNISIAEACIQYWLVYLTYLTIHLMTRTTRSTATPSISHVVQHWYQSRCALVKRKELLFKETAYESSSSSLSFSFCMPPGSCSRLSLYSCTPQTPPLSLSFIPGQL